MAFDAIRPALRALRDSLSYGAAALLWMGAVGGAVLLARENWMIAAVALGGAALVLLVPAWRRRRASFLMLAGSFPAFLFVAEVLIRLIYFGPDALAHPTRYQPIGAIADPDYLAPARESDVVYTLRPGFRGWVKGVLVEANGRGLRDDERALAPTPGTARVMTLGSSVAMGEGVPARSTFTARLGERLTAQGLAVETLNFAVGGYTLGTSQALLRARGVQFRPDVVVQELTLGMFDETAESIVQLRASFERTRRAPPPASVFETNSFAVFAIYPPLSLRARLAGLVAPRGQAREVLGPYVEETLAAFGRLAAAQGFQGVVFLPRPIQALADRTAQQRERDTLRRFAAADGLLYVDSYDRFSASDQVEALSIYPGELHPNAEAHARYAASLADALTPVLAARRATRR